MTGVLVATTALVVVLSVFNGFHDLVATLFTSFDPQLKVVPVMGKTAPADDPVLMAIRQLPEVDVATESVEDQALAVYRDRQAMVKVKGVDDNFTDLTHIEDIVYGDGEFSLHAANLEYGTPGIRLAQELGMGAYYPDYMKLYAPVREGQVDISNAMEGFTVDSVISPGVVFSVSQAKYDKMYVLTSIAFARRLFEQQGMLSSLELRLKSGSDIEAVKKEIRKLCGGKYKVMDRYEQQADTFKIMQIEKILAYIFLTFILIVACFNIIGSLSMLMIDKKDDVMTLRNMGASNKQIIDIFMLEGLLISLTGAAAGIVIGLLLCMVQQQFGLISLGGQSGAFIIEAYPVSVHYMDVLLVFVTVIVVGWLSAWYPVRYFSRRLLG